ncbi:MAG: apolipoprotein N-acyltransferase [Verrucomicrobia bacterium]|nr:apolipoprotein N-acyltransferase [Verrucomicrobiota bacterium]MCH8511686.1 apolipoprotein N-acyltransferase [Kiritimatiellia bacterium]
MKTTTSPDGLTDRLQRQWPAVLSVWSGLALFAAFEPFRVANLAFVALIPWMAALRARPEQCKRLSFIAGLAFWVPAVWFISPVTKAGALSLAMYCALWWVPSGVLWARALVTWRREKPLMGIRFLLGGSAWWCLMEWARGWAITGFPWNGLGVSQVDNLPLIQLASLGGVEAVSFVVVAMNWGIGLSVFSFMQTLRERGARRMHPELYVPILMLAVAFSWGMRQIRAERNAPMYRLRVGVVQPNVEVKWEAESAVEIRRILWEISDLALSQRPDLLLWPETALPDELRFSRDSANLVQSLVDEHGIPILLGSLDVKITETDDPKAPEVTYFNAAMLIRGDGVLEDIYLKRHLVMFGEYMPFARHFPFLRSLTPMPEDVTPGTEVGTMDLPHDEDRPAVRVGLLICFEDLMPYLSRDLVDAGTDLFVNLTNDGWFDPWWGSRAHLDHAVFRSIEQRRPTVRSTNTGVSAWIDTQGVVRDRVEDPQTGKYRVRGFSTFEIEIPREPVFTFYQRNPALFPILFGLMSLLLPWRPDRRGRREASLECA